MDNTDIIYRTHIVFYRHFLILAYKSMINSTGLSTNSISLLSPPPQFSNQHKEFKSILQSLSKVSFKCYYAILDLVEELRTCLRELQDTKRCETRAQEKQSFITLNFMSAWTQQLPCCSQLDANTATNLFVKSHPLDLRNYLQLLHNRPYLYSAVFHCLSLNKSLNFQTKVTTVCSKNI